ncbi:MAG: hypothetical protein ACYCX5_12940 [Coriobacteriia bacterium]
MHMEAETTLNFSTQYKAESWKHYYYDEPATAGDRVAAQQATHAVVAPVAQARAATAAARQPAPTEQVEGDGTPFGRFNQTLALSRPDGWDWTLTAGGATFEIIGYYPYPPSIAACKLIGLVIDVGSNVRTSVLWSQGERTALDLAVDVADTAVSLFTPVPGSIAQAACWTFLPVVDRAAGPGFSPYVDPY